MVGKECSGSYERATIITTKNGPATIMSIEDLIVNRPPLAKFWNVPTGVEQAILLAKAHDDSIDWNYVQDECRNADTGDYLAKPKETLAKRGK